MCIRDSSFTDGTTTFSAAIGGNVHVKDGSAGGPEVRTHMAENDAGAIIDLDGTGPATLVPPLVEQNLIFTGNHPYANDQYKNLMRLKGKHGTFHGYIPSTAGANVVVTVPARLVEVTGNWQPPHRSGTPSMMTLRAVWRFKDFA